MRLYKGHRHFFVLSKPKQEGAATGAHRACGRLINFTATACGRLIDFEGHRRLIDCRIAGIGVATGGASRARAAVFSTSYEEEAPLAKKLCRFFVFVLQYARKYGQPPHTGSRLKKSADLGAVSSGRGPHPLRAAATLRGQHPLRAAASHRAAIRKIQNGGFYDP